MLEGCCCFGIGPRASPQTASFATVCTSGCSPATRPGASPPTSPSCRRCGTKSDADRAWAILFGQNNLGCLVQRPQNPGPCWPHRVENSIRLGVAGVGLNSIPAVNDLPVLYEHGISARMPVILETNTSHPGPALERVYPAKSRYCECVVGCAIFEGVFEVFGDEVVVAWIRFGRWHLVGQSNVAAPWQQGNQEQERRSGSVPRRTCPLPFS